MFFCLDDVRRLTVKRRSPLGEAAKVMYWFRHHPTGSMEGETLAVDESRKHSHRSQMVPISTGFYSISRSNHQLTTMAGGSAKPGTPVTTLGPAENPGEQHWEVHVRSNGNVTIRNMQSKTFMSYEGSPGVNKPVVGCSDEREWLLYPSTEPSKFFVVVPGGPIEGNELALDLSLLRIFPPRTALRPLQIEDVAQAWYFKPAVE